MNWKALASAAAMAVLACGAAAYASDDQPVSLSAGGTQSVNPQLLDDTTAPAAAPASDPAAARSRDPRPFR